MSLVGKTPSAKSSPDYPSDAYKQAITELGTTGVNVNKICADLMNAATNDPVCDGEASWDAPTVNETLLYLGNETSIHALGCYLKLLSVVINDVTEKILIEELNIKSILRRLKEDYLSDYNNPTHIHLKSTLDIATIEFAKKLKSVYSCYTPFESEYDQNFGCILIPHLKCFVDKIEDILKDYLDEQTIITFKREIGTVLLRLHRCRRVGQILANTFCKACDQYKKTNYYLNSKEKSVRSNLWSASYNVPQHTLTLLESCKSLRIPQG